METKGCARLTHIGKSFLCICSRFIDAYVIVLSCKKHIRNVWTPLDALGTQNSKDWVCIHVENSSSCIHRMWDAIVLDRNKLAPEYVQILLNEMVEVFGSNRFPIWLWDPGFSWDGNLPNMVGGFRSL